MTARALLEVAQRDARTIYDIACIRADAASATREDVDFKAIALRNYNTICTIASSLEGQAELSIDDLEVARKAVEDELIERRDSRIAVIRNNGMCVNEADGSPSEIIRMGAEEVIMIGLKAIDAARTAQAEDKPA